MKSDRLSRQSPYSFIRCGVCSLRHCIDLGELGLPLETYQNTAVSRATTQNIETLRTTESLRHLHHQKLHVISVMVAVHDRPVINQLQRYVRAAALRWRLSSAEPVICAEPTVQLGNRDNRTWARPDVFHGSDLRMERDTLLMDELSFPVEDHGSTS